MVELSSALAKKSSQVYSSKIDAYFVIANFDYLELVENPSKFSAASMISLTFQSCCLGKNRSDGGKHFLMRQVGVMRTPDVVA